MPALDSAQPTTMRVPMMKEMVTPDATKLLGSTREEHLFGGDLGFAPGPPFQAPEIARIRTLIKSHLVKVAERVVPKISEILAATELEQFHTVEDFEPTLLLTNEYRPLPKEATDEILAMQFFHYVREAFGEFHLADEADRGYDQITFRLVRPMQIADVGCLHRDDWFWKKLDITAPRGMGRVKVWVPIISEPELDGLRVAAGSHRLDIPYRVESKHGKANFVTDLDLAKIHLCQFGGTNGTPLFFNYQTLHVGSLNRGTNCRVSIETTIMYKS